jgi:hypothetical protein
MNHNNPNNKFIFETNNIFSDENYVSNIKFLDRVENSIEAMEDTDVDQDDNFWVNIDVTDQNNKLDSIQNVVDKFHSFITMDFIDVDENVVSIPNDPTKPKDLTKVYLSNSEWEEWKKEEHEKPDGWLLEQIPHPVHGYAYIILESQIDIQARDSYRGKIHTLVTQIKTKCCLSPSIKARKFIENLCLEEFKDRLNKSFENLQFLKQYLAQFFNKLEENSIIETLDGNFGDDSDYRSSSIINDMRAEIDVTDDEDEQAFIILFDAIKGVYNRQDPTHSINQLFNKRFINKVTLDEFKQKCTEEFQRLPTSFQNIIRTVLVDIIDDDDNPYDMNDIKNDFSNKWGYRNSYIIDQIKEKLTIEENKEDDVCQRLFNVLCGLCVREDVSDDVEWLFQYFHQIEQRKAAHHSLMRATASGELLFFLLFAWEFFQYIPGMVPSKISFAVSHYGEIGLLVAICAVFLWMISAMIKMYHHINQENDSNKQAQALILSGIGAGIALFGFLLFLSAMLSPSIASYNHHMIGYIAPVLLIISITLLSIGRNVHHWNSHSPKNNQPRSWKEIISIGTSLLLIQLIGAGAFLGDGLVSANHTVFKNLIGMGWLLATMLGVAAIASGILFIKDLYEGYNNGVEYIPTCMQLSASTI